MMMLAVLTVVLAMMNLSQQNKYIEEVKLNENLQASYQCCSSISL
jgi:hypothetical protein